MRLGVYGGTFDPVHYGHLLLAEQCREQCGLDEVWFVPAATPPHKPDDAISPGDRRVEMLEFATAGHPQLRVCRIELDREGPSYTVETLEQLHGDQPDRKLFLLLGADSLADFPSWRNPAGILALAEVVVVNRGRRDPEVLPAAESLGEAAAGRIRSVTMPGIDLSASDIRRRVRAGGSIRYMTPRAVEMYIRQHELYR